MLAILLKIGGEMLLIILISLGLCLATAMIFSWGVDVTSHELLGLKFTPDQPMGFCRDVFSCF